MILSFVLEQGKDIPIPANPLFQPFHFQKQQQALIIESSAAMERNDSHARKQSASKRHAKFDFSQSTATHFTSESEIAAYINWINTQLASDTDLAEHLPIPLGKENALFEACNDGLLLCKLINNSVPTTIPEKVINKKPKSIIHRHENLQRALAGAVKIGVQVHNLSAEDLLQGTPHLCLGLIWQVIKIGLLQNVSPVGPESAHNSTQDMPSKADPSTQSLERALLKWVNGTLARLDAPVRIGNFGTDLSDSVALAFLIASFDDSDAKAREILAEADILKRAERTLEYAARFDCRHFASAGDIVGGNKNLNLAFVAVLHNLKVAREKNAAVRIELEGAKEDAEAKLLRVASSKDVELKRLKMQLQDMTEDAERLKEERDALETELNDYKVAAEGQEEYSAQADMLRTQLAGLEEELRASKKLNETVTSSFESLTHTVSEVYSAKEDLEKKLQSSRQNITNELPALQGQLNAANLKIMELEMENQMLRENLADLRTMNDSLQSLADLSAPANSMQNLNASQEDLENLSSKLQASEINSQSLQYRLLALQTANDEKEAQLQQALTRAKDAEQQVCASTESFSQLYAKVKGSLDLGDKGDTDLKKRQRELVQSIDTVYEETLQLTLLSKDDPERERLMQEQIHQMRQLTIQLVQHVNYNEAQVVERVISDLKHQGNLFDKLQLKDNSQRQLVDALSQFVFQLNSKAKDSEKVAQELSTSVETLNFELQKLKEKPMQQHQYREADIESVAVLAPAEKTSHKQEYIQLEVEKASLKDRLALLQKTAAAIMQQRSILINENKRLQDNQSEEALNLSLQIRSLDNLLEENMKMRDDMERNASKEVQDAIRLESVRGQQAMALQNAKVQTHIDAILKSEDCLIEDLTRMRESNENLQEQLENAQKCISALMAQRSILLKEREELKQSKPMAKSDQSLSADSEQNLSRTKHNNSFASAPNLSK